jgi:16S rRNA processing protein RimM
MNIPESPKTKKDQQNQAPSSPKSSSEAKISDEWVVIGKIVAPFGLKGEVKFLSETDFPDRISSHKILYIGPEHTPYTITNIRPHGGIYLLTFDTITIVEETKPLCGKIVSIPITAVAPLTSDQFYIHDLIGVQAIHINGTPLGKVTDVITGSAQDLLVIHRSGHSDVLVPFVKALVPLIDMDARTITIDPPGGLFDEDFVEVR